MGLIYFVNLRFTGVQLDLLACFCFLDSIKYNCLMVISKKLRDHKKNRKKGS